MTRASLAYLALMGPTILLLALNLALIFRLAVWRRPRGIAAILFGGLLTTKLWIATVLLYFSLAIVRPGLLARPARAAIALALALAILAQALGMLVALLRWYRGPGEAPPDDG